MVQFWIMNVWEQIPRSMQILMMYILCSCVYTCVTCLPSSDLFWSTFDFYYVTPVTNDLSKSHGINWYWLDLTCISNQLQRKMKKKSKVHLFHATSSAVWQHDGALLNILQGAQLQTSCVQNKCFLEIVLLERTVALRLHFHSFCQAFL
jgi:hypothetical protein